MFCDFDSEPGFAWNLIESFSLSNKDRFQVFTFSSIFYKYLEHERRTKAHSAEKCEIHSIFCCFHEFCFISDSFDNNLTSSSILLPLQENIVFYDDYQAISGDAPNWQAYLIKRPYLLWLRDHSTHWRATCRYNTDGTVYTDYLRASLEDFDIIRDVPLKADTCRPYEYVNIRGNECVNCTAFTAYKKGSQPLHVDTYITHLSCNLDASKTAIDWEDNFGKYYSTNPKFRCTSNSDDTTQFWIGGK